MDCQRTDVKMGVSSTQSVDPIDHREKNGLRWRSVNNNTIEVGLDGDSGGSPVDYSC